MKALLLDIKSKTTQHNSIKRTKSRGQFCPRLQPDYCSLGRDNYAYKVLQDYEIRELLNALIRNHSKLYIVIETIIGSMRRVGCM